MWPIVFSVLEQGFHRSSKHFSLRSSRSCLIWLKWLLVLLLWCCGSPKHVPAWPTVDRRRPLQKVGLLPNHSKLQVIFWPIILSFQYFYLLFLLVEWITRKLLLLFWPSHFYVAVVDLIVYVWAFCLSIISFFFIILLINNFKYVCPECLYISLLLYFAYHIIQFFGNIYLFQLISY